MRITEILSNQEQINLVRLIMNATLNALGQPAQAPANGKSPVVQAVKNNRKPAAKAPKIPTPPAPKPFPKPKPLASATSRPLPKTTSVTAGSVSPTGKRIQPSLKAMEKAPVKVPKSLQPLPTSVLSPINKNPTPAEKKELEKKNELIDYLKSAQTNR